MKNTLKNYYDNKSINIDNNELTIPYQLREHPDAVFMINTDDMKPMKDCKITMTELEYQMKKAKTKTVAGSNEIKTELLIAMIQNDKCKTTLLQALNAVIDTGIFPDTWKTSNNKLLEKKAKPTIKDLRPIALTDTTQILLMGIIKK